MSLYTMQAVDNLLTRCEEENWDITYLNYGCLLGGDVLLQKNGMRSIVVYEKYLNEWSSAYTMKTFNSNSPKSLKMLNKLVDKLTDTEV